MSKTGLILFQSLFYLHWNLGSINVTVLMSLSLKIAIYKFPSHVITMSVEEINTEY
jgi:hypothetical protein